MASNMVTTTIPCRGGLNQSSNLQELLTKPGEATVLRNFECSISGGYRRLSGYSYLDSVSVPGTGDIQGIKNYHGGIIAVRNGVPYFSEDGSYWLQVNKDIDNGNETALLAASVTARSNCDRVMFTQHQNGAIEYLLSTDGVNAPNILSIQGTTRANSTYRYREIVEGVSLVGAKYCEMNKGNFVIAGMPSNPSSIYYSSHASTDLTSPADDDKEVPQENFDGSTSGFIGVGDIVMGLKEHREALYVFCKNSIHKIVGMETGDASVVPITGDIGCLDGFTIQEVGGDLLFLAPDGIRTMAKTDKLDDLELGVISRKVSTSMLSFLRVRDRYQYYATVVRAKNQYRLWAIDKNNLDSAQQGVIAAFTYDDTKGSFSWDYSTMSGLGVTCVDNSLHKGVERIVHGNQGGRVCEQESGHLFGTSRIEYQYQSPYVHFGDIGTRKNIHKVTTTSKPEGPVEMGLEIKYDYQKEEVHQPLIYPMIPLSQPALFGDPLVVFGNSFILFGTRDIPDTGIYTEGSGFTVSFRVVSLDLIDDHPFDIQSLQIDLTGGGKI